MTAVLARSERADLDRLEVVIQRGLATFIEVGNALTEIRERKLYRLTHPTWEAYCQERWRFTANYSYRIMGAAEIASDLLPNGTVQPQCESQVRPLADVPREDRNAVWEAAVESAGGQPTALQVAAAKALAQLPAEAQRAILAEREEEILERAEEREQADQEQERAHQIAAAISHLKSAKRCLPEDWAKETHCGLWKIDHGQGTEELIPIGEVIAAILDALSAG